jgi:hypothetical protein
MSGQKYATITLSDAARQQLLAETERAQRAGQIVARVANLGGRLHSLLEETSRFMATDRGSVAFRDNVEAFTRDVDQFQAKRSELQALVGQVAATAARETQSALDQVRQQRQHIEPLATALEDLAAGLDARIPLITSGLSAEAKSEAYREEAEHRRLQREVAGLRAELASRADPGALGSLAALPEKTHALDTRLGAAARSAGLSDTDVAACRSDLDALVAEAADLAMENLERLEKFARIDAGCREGGLTRVTEAEVPPLDQPITATYVQREGSSQSSLEWQIYRGHRVNVNLRTARVDNQITFAPSEFCYTDDVPRIVELLYQQGLVATDWGHEDPDHPGSWNAIDVEDSEERPILSKAPELRAREAKLK